MTVENKQTNFSATSKIFRPQYGTGTGQVCASKGESTTDCTGLPPHHISTNEFTLVYIICSKSPHPTWLHSTYYVLHTYLYTTLHVCTTYINGSLQEKATNFWYVGLTKLAERKYWILFVLILIYSL